VPVLPPPPPDVGRVAVVIPAHNEARFLAHALESLQAQSYEHWRAIVVDDQSSDDTTRIAAGFAARVPRVQVLRLRRNAGLPAARNAGVAATSAPLLFFLDSDDLIAPTALEKLAWLLHSDDRPAFATSWAAVFGAEELRWARGFESRDHFLFQNMATPMTMIRRAVFEAVGGFDEARTHGLEDYELWLRCAARGFWGMLRPLVGGPGAAART
jgi:glycosyltransferase involved in cell wall biosynthesis